MEKPEIETPKTPLNVPRRRKQHLQSETYRTLVRILTECYKHPQLCGTAQLQPQERRPDNHDTEPKEASEKHLPEQIERVIPDCMDHKNSLTQNIVSVDENFDSVGFQEREFSDTQAVIHEIENIMRIEEGGDSSKLKNMAVKDGNHGIGLPDQEFGHLQELLMSELEQAMKGNEDVVCDDNCNSAIKSLNENVSGGDVVALPNKQEECLDLQPIVMEECKIAGQQQVDKKHPHQNTLETIDSSFHRSVTCDDSKLSYNSQEKGSLLRSNELGDNHEMQKIEMDSGRLVCATGAVGSPNHLIEDGEMEEGEISGEFKVNDRVIDGCSDVATPLEQKKQLSDDNIGKNEFSFNDKKEANKMDSGSISITVDMVDNLPDRREVESKDVGNEMIHKRKVVVYGDSILTEGPYGCKKQKKGYESKESCKPKKGSRTEKKKKGNVKGYESEEPKKANRTNEKKKDPVCCPMVVSNNLALSAQKKDQNAPGSQGIACKKKMQEDADRQSKKRRGPPSEERKAKKKENKRKKRAQKNRELGVKRLKLRPVENPKPVALCRHYIKGRCQEGEKCKFSHDTIPLTKSKPCCHFARHSCLKGDDCPFDHQLSKYPCNSYVTMGSCSRGEDCMFSHKVPLKEDIPVTSNFCTPELKPLSLRVTSNSKKQLDCYGTSDHTNTASPVIGATCKITQQNAAKSLLSQPVLVPKGISFFSGGKSSAVESGPTTPGGSSLTRNEGLKVGSQTNQSASGTIHNSNETPSGTPAITAHKGINFLSFGKPSLEFSSAKKLTTNNASKLSFSNNSDVNKQSTSPLSISNSSHIGSETSQSMSNTNPWSNKMLQKTEFAAAPLKSDILSFRESSVDNSRSISQGSFPSSSATYVGGSVQASKVIPDKHEILSTISQGVSASPLGSGQSADYLAHACLKNTSNSAQKALLSTLAFAAKFESEMKMKQSAIGALAVRSKVDKEIDGTTTGSQNDSAKALKILDFLSSVGRK